MKNKHRVHTIKTTVASLATFTTSGQFTSKTMEKTGFSDKNHAVVFLHTVAFLLHAYINIYTQCIFKI